MSHRVTSDSFRTCVKKRRTLPRIPTFLSVELKGRDRLQETEARFHLLSYNAMNFVQTKLRRSLRLLYNGYYNCDGLPTISYRETRVRRHRNRRRVKTKTTEVPVEDSFDSSINENQRKNTLLQFWWIVIVLSLFS
ncbi:hypothetical protein AMECASPLE_039216, partial [Ameca splendens]